MITSDCFFLTFPLMSMLGCSESASNSLFTDIVAMVVCSDCTATRVCCVCVLCVCVWEVFLLRRVAGNLSIAL